MFFHPFIPAASATAGIVVVLLCLHTADVRARPDIGLFESCVNTTSHELGRCMFAMDCLKMGGRHIGVCIRGFYYGSCCSVPEELAPRVPIMTGGSVHHAAADGPVSGPMNWNWSLWPDLLAADVHLPPPINAVDMPSVVIPSVTSVPTTSLVMTSTTPKVAIIYANVTDDIESLYYPSEPVELETDGDEEVDFASSFTVTTVPTTTTTTTTTTLPTLSTSNKVNDTVLLMAAAVLPAVLNGLSDSSSARDYSTAAVCGKPVYRWPKIVSGENARPGQWPWMISLQEKTRRGYFHKCGASLLTRQWAITAAHCLNGVQPENLLLRLGGVDFASIDDNFVDSKVQAFQHPQFNVQNQQNDIALLKLLTPVTYQSSILPICLPDSSMNFEEQQSFVAGWGRLDERGPTSTKLQYVGVPIINNSECERIYRPVNKYIDHRSICAGYPMGLKDSCEGDSGGPMMVFKGRWVLAGIISWGVGCARPSQPGVSTRVTEFLDWIKSHVGEEDDVPLERTPLQRVSNNIAVHKSS